MNTDEHRWGSVLAGRALRRIAGAEASGGEIRVTTEPATLNEAIADGVVAWDRAITFSPDKIGAVAVADAKAAPDGDTIEFALDLEAYKVSIEVRLGGDRSDFKFTLVKELMGDAGALILGSTGYDLGFLGIVSLGGDSVEFFKQQRPLLRAGQCPEE